MLCFKWGCVVQHKTTAWRDNFQLTFRLWEFNISCWGHCYHDKYFRTPNSTERQRRRKYKSHPTINIFSILQETRSSGIQKPFHRKNHKNWTNRRQKIKTGYTDGVTQNCCLGHTASIFMSLAVSVCKHSPQLDLQTTDLLYRRSRDPYCSILPCRPCRDMQFCPNCRWPLGGLRSTQYRRARERVSGTLDPCWVHTFPRGCFQITYALVCNSHRSVSKPNTFTGVKCWTGPWFNPWDVWRKGRYYLHPP